MTEHYRSKAFPFRRLAVLVLVSLLVLGDEVTVAAHNATTTLPTTTDAPTSVTATTTVPATTHAPTTLAPTTAPPTTTHAATATSTTTASSTTSHTPTTHASTTSTTVPPTTTHAPPTTTKPSTHAPTTERPSSNGAGNNNNTSDTGALVGIAVGSSIGGFALVVGLFCLFDYRQRAAEKALFAERDEGTLTRLFVTDYSAGLQYDED